MTSSVDYLKMEAGYDSPCLQVDGETKREDLLARGLRPEVVEEIMNFRERLAKKYAPRAESLGGDK